MILQIDKTEEIHHQFQEFLNEIGKPTNDYELKIANRLFGEKTYLFLQVSFAVVTTSVSSIGEWPMALLGLYAPEAAPADCLAQPTSLGVSFCLSSRHPGPLGVFNSGNLNEFCLNPVACAKNMHGSTQSDLPRF